MDVWKCRFFSSSFDNFKCQKFIGCLFLVQGDPHPQSYYKLTAKAPFRSGTKRWILSLVLIHDIHF